MEYNKNSTYENIFNFQFDTNNSLTTNNLYNYLEDVIIKKPKFYQT